MRALVLALLVAACTTSSLPPSRSTPLDPAGTWMMSFVYTAGGCNNPGTLPESWMADSKGSIGAVVWNGLAVDATVRGSGDCAATDCSYTFAVSWTIVELNAEITQVGSWTLRSDGSIDGFGTLTSVDTGTGITCSESFTVSGKLEP